MTLHDLIGDANQAANQLKFNDLYQTGNSVTTRAGIGTLGYHAYLCVGSTDPSTYFNLAWKEYIDQMYSAMQQFTSYTARYSKAQLGAYLHYCYWCDWLIAEGTRDLNMLNWDSDYDATAKTDYWGPNADSVLINHLPVRPLRITRAMNAISAYARQFPHVVTPWSKTIEYLVSNVFTDDDTKRTNYVYLHLFNDTMRASIPNPYRCFDLLESIANITASTWTIDGNTVTNPFASGSPAFLDENQLGNIRADLAKCYAANLTYPHYDFLESNVLVTPTFDPVVCHALNQGQYGYVALNGGLNPASGSCIIPPAAAEPLIERPIWAPASNADINAFAAFGCMLNLIPVGDRNAPRIIDYGLYDVTLTSGGNTPQRESTYAAIDEGMGKLLGSGSYQFTYYGPSFEGEPVLEGLIFDQTCNARSFVSLNAGAGDVQHKYVVAFNSEYGITLGSTWNNSINTTSAPAINYMYPRVLTVGCDIGPGPARWYTGSSFRSSTYWHNVENARITALNTDAFAVWNYVYSKATNTGNTDRFSCVSTEDVDEFTLFNMSDEAVIASSVMRGVFGNSIVVPATKRQTELVEEQLGFLASKTAGYGNEDDDGGSARKKSRWKGKKRK